MSTATTDATPARPDEPRTAANRWLRPLAGAFRTVTWLQLALVFAQATLAGHLLTGNATALDLHELLGTEVLTLVAVVQFVLAVLVWRPGRGPWWPAVLALGVFADITAQIHFGFGGRLALHVPNGVLILLAQLWLLAGARRAWAQPSRTARAA